MQVLRHRRRPVSGSDLAAELGVSLRTIYRDIATLVDQGAAIEGEAGFGFVLKPGFFLPPLMFNTDEVDVIMLGLQLAAERGDPVMVAASKSAMAKIAAVLPSALGEASHDNGLIAAPARSSPHLLLLRRSMRAEERVLLTYQSEPGAVTVRVVWPVAIGFFEAKEVLVAWCEARAAFRHFRLDRIYTASPTGIRIPRRRSVLLAEWKRFEGVER